MSNILAVQPQRFKCSDFIFLENGSLRKFFTLKKQTHMKTYFVTPLLSVKQTFHEVKKLASRNICNSNISRQYRNLAYENEVAQ